VAYRTKLNPGFIGKGIVLKRGAARFTGPEALDVAGESLRGRHFVIATGSRPTKLPIEGFQYTITSDELLSEPPLPQSLVFIGGGVIALEFGHVFARAGTAVTILEAAPRLLPALDRDAVAELARATQAAGIKVETGVEVLSIEPTSVGFAVRYRRGRDHLIARAERVANGAGREADLEGLDLAVGQVQHEGPRISVDIGLRSVSNPRVYVAGDALWSSPQLSPVATYEGQIVGRAILEAGRSNPIIGPFPSACTRSLR
jgi:glutathione reductase (NADPH)